MEPPKGYNRHHLWYARSDYRQGLRRAFRNFQGNVIPVLVESHNELHANLPPPPIPSRRQMLDGMDVLSEADPRSITSGAIALAAYFYGEALRLAPEQSEKALRISEHLNQQLGYLTLERVYEQSPVRR